MDEKSPNRQRLNVLIRVREYEKLKALAERNRRSMTQQVEWMIERDYQKLPQADAPIQEPQS